MPSIATKYKSIKTVSDYDGSTEAMRDALKTY